MEKKIKSVAIVTSVHPDFDARIWKHAESLVAKGIEVHLICPWNIEDASIFKGVNFHTFKVEVNRYKRILFGPFKIFKKLRGLRKQVDLFHFHDLDLIILMALFSFRNKVVYDVHENYADEVLNKFWIPKLLRKPIRYIVYIVEKICSRKIKNIVLVAPSQERYFDSVKLNKIYIKNFASQKLMNAYVDDYFERESSVIFIGSQHENNGCFLFLDIAEEVSKKQLGIKFFASDRFRNKAIREKYLHLIEEKGLTDVVSLVPNVQPDKICDLLNVSTIGINPNLRVEQQINGIHTKVFEFMALALPYVTSDLPHQKMVIEKSGGGLLAQPESVESFVNAILKLHSDREAAYKIGMKGQSYFQKNYSYETQTDSLVEFYEKVIC